MARSVDGALMLLLGIDTSTARTSVALVDRDGLVASSSLAVPRSHGGFLAPAIAGCLSAAGVGPERVTGVAVGLGPGLFTGLRVGIATAQTFAAALRVPVVGLCGLDVMAFAARIADRPVVATIDARRGELFWAAYRPVPGGVQRVSGPTVGRADALAAELEAMEPGVLVVGEGGLANRDVLERPGVHVTDAGPVVPDAADLARLALPRFEREETQHPTDLQPIYLRGVDARIGWEERGRLHGGRAS
jgi:tRNA threonylcarbamoyladenosine biosynthesis protein TsaB